jgi:hypothetical protein
MRTQELGSVLMTSVLLSVIQVHAKHIFHPISSTLHLANVRSSSMEDVEETKTASHCLKTAVRHVE